MNEETFRIIRAQQERAKTEALLFEISRRDRIIHTIQRDLIQILKKNPTNTSDLIAEGSKIKLSIKEFIMRLEETVGEKHQHYATDDNHCLICGQNLLEETL